MTFTQLLESVRYLQGLEDSPHYRAEWELDGTPWAFDDSIQMRVESLVCEYAMQQGLTREEVSLLVCNNI